MSTAIDIEVPDIGDFTDIPVIEIFVKPGDRVKAEDPLISLESDKATMEVPSPRTGVVKSVSVNIGDKVSAGAVIMQFEDADGEQAPARPSVTAPPPSVSAPSGVAEVRVPDIGDFKDVPVIEIFVKPGDEVKAEDPLLALESDKATMDVPSPLSGKVQDIRVKVGDKISEGAVILTLASGDGAGKTAAAPVAAPAAAPSAPAAPAAASAPGGAIDEKTFATAYAGPAVRGLAREKGVDLGKVSGTGKHGRITREDVEAFAKGGGAAAPAKSAASAAPAGGGGGLDLLPWPKVDFAKYGPVERKELGRIKKISAANLHRNWVVIPHVTNHDEADITDLEQFRVRMNKELEKSGVKLSLLPFMVKAAVATLKKFPEFNASLDGDALVYKNYWHIGFAADTPNGLMVPVIKDADKKTIPEIAKEMGDLAKLAREGKIKPDQMQGGTFSISSLGGIGGVYFTPIINAPEVAIMGVCKGFWKQHSSDGKTFTARLTLPLSLSWDHRVIDGAAAARFNAHFAGVLADMRRVLF
ncbi:dihydrolipoyllysine-residue acetyltransferase [Methylopila sp. M107]|uniref:dihydrolipoyllysine-residue acetyltransferase n=1 Tax=Methylopila sp. M107 TaxID=1101190 RepID=UPI000373B0D9|nr:dihydrolipoyllysine-residue acetyltransferase [Methylopila sp. M107]